jgi:hypothetical protein
MSKYPYDKEKICIAENFLLKQSFTMSFELMQVYQPFGQAASTYEDTGYPEYVALGLRTFLSVPENIQMLRDIGEKTHNTLVMLGLVYTTQGSDAEKEEWGRLMKEMKKANKRTHDSIQEDIKKEMVKCKQEK